MGWKAIKTLNKMAEVERLEQLNAPVAPEPVNALKELSPEPPPAVKSEIQEVLSGPEGWVVGVSEHTVLEFESGEVIVSEPVVAPVENPVEEEVVEEEAVTPEVAVEKKPKAKKPKKAPEPIS